MGKKAADPSSSALDHHAKVPPPGGRSFLLLSNDVDFAICEEFWFKIEIKEEKQITFKINHCLCLS